MSEYQKILISLCLFFIAISFTFKDVIVDNKVFATPDSQSAAAVGKGMEQYKSEFGEYPKWNPWIFSGVPATHSFQHVSRYYPPFYFFKLLNNIGMPKFFNYLAHFLFLGIGIFLILYRLKINFIACLFSGLTFTLMPYLITMVVHGHGSQMMTTAYIPWIYLFLEKLREKQDLFNFSVFSLLIGFQLLRGHVQIAYYTWLIIGLYSLILLFSDIKTNKIKFYRGFYFILILALCIGFISSLQLYYPAYSYSPFSIRSGSDGGTGYDYATAWSFSFGEMLTFFNPKFYGFGGATYWGNMPFTDYPNYMSIISVTLMLYSVFYVKNINTKILVSIWFISLLLSFGHNTPIYNFFYLYFPFFNKFRVPAMFLIVLQFSTVILSGIGLNYILKYKINNLKKYLPFFIPTIILVVSKLAGSSFLKDSDKTHNILDVTRISMINSGFTFSFIILFLFFVLIFLFNKKVIKLEIVGIGILLLLIVDLGKVNNNIINPSGKYNNPNLMMSSKDFKNLHKDDQIIKFLKSDTSNYRILPLPPLLNDNRWSAFQIQNVGGYHPAKLQNYQTLMAEVGFNNPGYLQMLNVKYLISLNELNHPMFQKIFSGELNHKGKIEYANIYLNKFGTNSIYFPKDIVNYKDINELITILKNPYYSPLNSIYMKDVSEGLNSNGKLIDYNFNSDKIIAKIDMEDSGLIIFSEVFYPNGWECFVNNKPVDILEANGLLRAIKLEKGLNDIEMIFNPSDLKTSKIISNISFIFILISIIIGLIRKHR